MLIFGLGFIRLVARDAWRIFAVCLIFCWVAVIVWLGSIGCRGLSCVCEFHVRFGLLRFYGVRVGLWV